VLEIVKWNNSITKTDRTTFKVICFCEKPTIFVKENLEYDIMGFCGY